MIILPSTLRFLIERATIQVDQWDRVERGRGPELDCLRERAETFMDILRDVSELPMPPKLNNVCEHAARINDIAREPWVYPARRKTMHHVEEDIEDYLRKHFMETTPPDGDEEPDWSPVLASKPPEDDDDLRFPGGQPEGGD